MGTILELDTHGERGFRIDFAFSHQTLSNLKAQILGAKWDKKSKCWYSDGPEILLDCRRHGYKLRYTQRALERAREFRVLIDDILDIRHRPLSDAEFNYQDIGIDYLAAAGNAILADDPGMGKSRQAILAARRIDAQRILVVAPNTITFNWLDEVAKWTPDIPAAVVPKTPRDRKLFWDNWDGRGYVIANYEKLMLKDWPQDIAWDVVIADEATYIKNASAGRSKAFWKTALKARTESIWLLSGTPIEIRVEELYALLGGIRPSVFGQFNRFRDAHLITDYFGKIVGVRDSEVLSERFAPWVLRRTKDDVNLNIPPKLYNDVYIELDATERATYKRLLEDFDAWLEEHEEVGGTANALTQLLRLQQYTTDPRLVDEPGPGSKIKMLKEMVDGWGGKNIVVFTRFKAAIPQLRDALDSHPDAIVSGDVDAAQRMERIRRFNAGQLGKTLLMTDAGGQGINVTSADLIIQHDLLWNPAKMRQREDRLHRIGQTERVNVARLIVRSTVDQGMAAVLEERQNLSDALLRGAEERIAQGLDLRKVARGQG